ncbi:MAG: hypothetical protein B6I37_08050, partial [Desulfobacteraceae bacterium 4572_35.2]
ELLIALVIFAVGILGVATMQITSIKGNSKGRQISEAVNVAADRIERIITQSYENAPNFDGAEDTNGDGVNDISWTVIKDSPVVDSKTIKVIVVPHGNSKNVEMTIIKVDI